MSQNNPAIRESVRDDLEFLLENIKDPETRPYLRPHIIESLVRLGHERYLAVDEANKYFKRTLQ